MQLPEGYDTKLEQRGGNLSLGQRQLISFARALVADAKILVLDEATASIDSYTEMLIQKALVRLLEGRTGLVIAHRLATIRDADRIIVLQNGEIIESGNHERADGKKRGLYARLYNMNYACFDDISGRGDPAARRSARRPDGLPLQNRVTPFGDIVAVPERGMFTGNRGIIHDPATKTLLNRRWSSKAWIVCSCEYKGVRRDVWARRSWTELFFLDEATALSRRPPPLLHLPPR